MSWVFRLNKAEWKYLSSCSSLTLKIQITGCCDQNQIIAQKRLYGNEECVFKTKIDNRGWHGYHKTAWKSPKIGKKVVWRARD